MNEIIYIILAWLGLYFITIWWLWGAAILSAPGSNISFIKRLILWIKSSILITYCLVKIIYRNICYVDKQF